MIIHWWKHNYRYYFPLNSTHCLVTVYVFVWPVNHQSKVCTVIPVCSPPASEKTGWTTQQLHPRPVLSLCVQAWSADGSSDTVPSSSTAKHERGTGPFSRMNLRGSFCCRWVRSSWLRQHVWKHCSYSVSINTQGHVLINMFTSLPPSFSLSVCPFPSFFWAPPPPLSLLLFPEQIIRLSPFPLFFSHTSLYPASAQTWFPSECVPALFVLPSCSQQLCYNPTPPGALTRSTEIKTETDGECLSYSSGGRSMSCSYFDHGNI